MCDAIAHRGPDGHGQFLDERAALGHRRLSIIDLEGGAQPIANEDGRFQVVFNGEIYNYLELREDLQRKGHQFKTSSDTEVLVHLYEDVGEKLPEYLNGMFAFAIWDCRDQSLFLARDRFGKKPLYYSLDIPGYRIAFASELKALTVMPGADLAVRHESVADFLAFSYVPDPHTIYRKFRKLAPATSLLLAEAPRLRRYWELKFEENRRLVVSEELPKLDALAADAVQRRMISDVPLGAFLSGGVDSSAVVAYMRRAQSNDVLTFSIGFTKREFDETRYARLVASRFGTRHAERTVTPAVEEMLGTLLVHFDEPFGDASAIPTLYLSRMTREHVTVALSGDGADEIMGGYRRYRLGVAEEKVRRMVPSAAAQRWFRILGDLYPKFDYLPRPFRAKATLLNLALGIGDAYFSTMTAFRDEALQDVLSGSLKQAIGDYDPRPAYRDRFARLSHLPPLQQMQSVDIDTYLPGDILVKADRATMAYSLEGRSPWLDYRIAENCAAFPQSWKVKGVQGKYVFKKLLEPMLPSDVLWRPKMGFSVPLAHWFRTSLAPIFEASLLAGSCDEYVDRSTVAALWKQHQSGLSDHSRKLWNLLMLAGWDAVCRRGLPPEDFTRSRRPG
jgi:asparagine synthase (glutamine-hydrolysing)